MKTIQKYITSDQKLNLENIQKKYNLQSSDLIKSIIQMGYDDLIQLEKKVPINTIINFSSIRDKIKNFLLFKKQKPITIHDIEV